MLEDHAAQTEAEMRNLIFAINLTLDGCCDHTKFNPPPMTKYLNITRTSCEILTCSSMGVKPIN